ncbi:MAG TPA: SMP-30/gluconolactonase/LRE family protein [Trebonia sp.]|nr:SMP-30/gluconolactonase/LRE family protein [Trebonia sp.]
MTAVRTAVKVEPVGNEKAVLGEGPYWVPEDDCLLWVDIDRGQLHRTYLPSGSTDTLSLDAASAAFPAVGGGLLTAGGSKLALHLPAERGEQWVTRVIAEVPVRDGLRFNDAGVDPAGRVWVGSMHTAESEPLAELYRLDAGGTLTTVVKGVTVSNGLGWSPDGGLMYYVDSPLRRIEMFDYDPATGEAFQRRTFADLSGFDGVPDGLTVDADGYVWVAVWGGGVLRRFAPDGTQDAVVPMPVSQPTSMAFGGPGLADLFVTSASIGLSEAELAAQPLAGRLLRLTPGPVGLPSTTAYAAIPA